MRRLPSTYLALACGLAIGGCEAELADQMVVVPPDEFYAKSFVVSEDSASLRLSVSVSRGLPVQTCLMTEPDYEAWKRREKIISVHPICIEGRSTALLPMRTNTPEYRLLRGTYWFVVRSSGAESSHVALRAVGK